jgi:hypothetical protein
MLAGVAETETFLGVALRNGHIQAFTGKRCFEGGKFS